MIAKGIPHANGPRLARYLITPKQGEHAELWQLRGFASPGIVDAFRSVHVIARATKCKDAFFHLQVRNPESETLTREQWAYAADRIERMLGLSDQPRAIAFHMDALTGHEHMHVAWSRIDHDTLTARPLPFYKTRLKTISRELEKDFGLAPVRNQRESSIKYAPTRSEEQQARRLGLDIHEVRESIRNSFEDSHSGRTFQTALTNLDLVLARGERRDFVVIDRAGGLHALGKRILGIPAAAIRQRLSDLRSIHLPTVEQARHLVRDRQPEIGKRSSIAELTAMEPTLYANGKADSGNDVQKVDPAEQFGCTSFVAITPAPQPNFEAPVEADNERLSGFRAMEHEQQSGPRSLLVVTPEPQPGLEARVTPEIASPGRDAIQSMETVPEAPGQSSPGQKRPRFSETLKREFRALVGALTRPNTSPQPKNRKKRREERAAGFRLAARSILRPLTRLPLISYAAAFLQDTLDWLHLWASNDSADASESVEYSGSREENGLFPHP